MGPHYHVLLWIRGAPVVGQHKHDRVIAWIQECHISVSLESHRLVTTANEERSVASTVSLPDAVLDFLGKPVKMQN